MGQSDKDYTGSIPAFYDHYLGPMLFAPYAVDLAARIAAFAPLAVLETAAGTGIVTARIAEVLSDSSSITATDLNPAMLDTASAKINSSRIKWQVCDATQLPFANAIFDCVLCQFGVMFFPSKVGAYKEARRVLISNDFPLRGFLMCEHCKHPLTACWARSHTGQKHPYPTTCASIAAAPRRGSPSSATNWRSSSAPF